MRKLTSLETTDNLPERQLLCEAVGCIQNVVVGLVPGEVASDVGVVLPFEPYRYFAQAGPDGHAAVEEPVAGEGIERAGEFAGVKIQDVVTLFKIVQLFQDRDRNDEVVFRELMDAGAVVQDDVGVENEKFYRLGLGHRNGVLPNDRKVSSVL